MEFKVFGESKQVRSTVYFRLKEDAEDAGDVNLFACDENGKRISCGTILKIKSNGTLTRSVCVSDKLGLQLDKGKIREV